jgi:RHS repeat-associated protein
VPTTTPSAELRYAYDASDDRTLKMAVSTTGAADSYTGYVFDSLELRHTTWNGADYAQNPSTEVAYLDAHGVRLARLHYALEDEPSAASGRLHVLMDLADDLGSTSVVVDHDTSELVEARGYLAYGDAESDYRPERWASFREDHGFTGKEDDIELGLQYFGKRYLVSALGRWASADPLSLHALGADANLYAYVHGRLLSASDPLGLAETCSGGGCRSYSGPSDVPEQSRSQSSECSTGGCVSNWTPQEQKALRDASAQRTTKPLEQPILDPIDFVPTELPAGLVEGGLKAGAKWLAREGSEIVEKDAAEAGARAAARTTVKDVPKEAAEAARREAARDAEKAAGTCAGGQCTSPSVSCFPAGTLVQLESGMTPIEDVELGARVRTANEGECGDGEPAGDLFRVRLEVPTTDGSGELIEVELLRDAEWVRAHGIAVGEHPFVQVDGVGAEGLANVEEVAPFGEIPRGVGCAVTGRLTHYNGHVLDLSLDGAVDLQVTSYHPVYSATRNQWVTAGDLLLGEKLAAASGDMTVQAVTPVPATLRVFNLEVAQAHTFRVTSAGIWVHNACSGGNGGAKAPDVVTANGQRAAADGTRLGPSGKPEYHYSNSATRKQAIDAAKAQGSGQVVKDNAGRVQPEHWHAVEQNGERVSGPGKTHFNVRGAKPKPQG